MAKIPSPLHEQPVPKSVSKPTETAEAAATVAESAVAPAPRKRAAPARKAAAKKSAKAAAPAKKAAPAAKKAAAAKSQGRGAGAGKARPAAPAAEASAKPAKAHKPKLVRDSFTIPKDEYQVLEALKTRALGMGQHVRKSELLRAGIRALEAMADRAFLKAVGDVPTLKTGRPKKG